MTVHTATLQTMATQEYQEQRSTQRNVDVRLEVHLEVDEGSNIRQNWMYFGVWPLLHWATDHVNQARDSDSNETYSYTPILSHW